MKFWKSLFAMLGILFLGLGSAQAATLNVPENYTTLQSAVEAATDGDIISIASGTYSAGANIDQSKSTGTTITLECRGAALSCIIEGSFTTHLTGASPMLVHFNGLLIRGPGSGQGFNLIGHPVHFNDCAIEQFDTGIYTQFPGTVMINNSSIRNNSTGILASPGSGLIELNNVELSTNGTGLDSGSNGVSSNNVTVRDSLITNNTLGIKILSPQPPHQSNTFRLGNTTFEYNATHLDVTEFFPPYGTETIDEGGNLYDPAPDLTQSKIIEDFEDNNLWSPETTLGWWDIDGAQVYQHTLENSAEAGSIVQKITYNKLGYAWSLTGGFIDGINTHRDFEHYNTVRLRVDSGTHERVLLKLRDRNFNEQDIAFRMLGRSLDDGYLTVDFDYSHLNGGSVNLSDIDNILFFFAPGSDVALAGEKTIDSIELAHTQQIESFENASGDQSWFNVVPQGQSYTPAQHIFVGSTPQNVTDDVAAEQYGFFRFTYDETNSPDYISGLTLIDGNLHNFKAFRTLSFWVRNQEVEPLTLKLTLENTDWTRSKTQSWTISSSEWVKVEVDLADLFFNDSTAFDMQDVNNLIFEVETTHEGVGHYDLDDIRLSH